LTKFGKQYDFDVSPYTLSSGPAGNVEELKSRIKTITEQISTISKTPFDQFDYPHQIKAFDDATQKQLWCLRTLLFYQLLLTVTEMMNNEGLFNQVYQGSEIKRSFRKDIVANLKNYKLGIFGSITPASDIDIGIQYSGFNDLIGLAYVVSVFEDSFLIFTGKESLRFDIETYGDLVTFPDVRDKPLAESTGGPECVNIRDVFPFDISAFNIADLISVLPSVFAGILRNYVIAKKSTLNADAVANIPELVNQFNIDDFLKVTADKTGTNMFEFLMKAVPSEDQAKMQEELTNAIAQAKTITVKYMDSSYADSREEYYKLVQTAEESLLNAKKMYFETKEVKMTNDELVNAVKSVSNALIFREESYINPSTVMHVVRVLQANANNPKKYETVEPSYCVTNRLTDAYCNIGNYGYIISMFEQLGYIYRFHITYCVSDPPGHYDAEKCAAKTKKYMDRFKNAMELYKDASVATSPAVTSPAVTSPAVTSPAVTSPAVASLAVAPPAEPLINPMQQSVAIMATAGGRKRKHTTKYNAIKKCKKTRKNKNKKTRVNKTRVNKTRVNKTRVNKTRVKYTCKK
jgi:hypothetical protein